MKRTLLLMILLFEAVFSAGAQILRVNRSGEDISKSYYGRIDRILAKEVEFYGPLGLPDTVTLNLKVFKDYDSANKFIREYDPLAYGRYAGGVFIASIGTAVVTSTENMDYVVKAMLHEISHFLYHKVLYPSSDSDDYYDYDSDSSLNEGLACYFSFMKVRKDGMVSQEPDKLYVASVKSLIEIDEFNLDEYLRMTGVQFDIKHRNDGAISYHVSYVITATLFEKLGTEKMRELLAMIRDGISYEQAVDELYPGGKAALEEDIRLFVSK